MTNQTPRISVVIPSYNKVKYIEKTLRSVMMQDYNNMEVIVQDGESNDGTLEITEKYVRKYPGVFKLESKKDGGQLDAINIGLKKATGDILTFINADDEYFLGAFDAISKAYSENPNALWFAGRGCVINPEGKEIAKPVTWYKNLLLSLNSKFHLLTTNYLMQPSVFLTRNVWEKFGSFTGTSSFVMEYDLWLKLSKISMPIVLNKNISKFRIEEGTKTKNMFKSLLDEDWKIVKKYTNNPVILGLHKINNFGRMIVEKFV
jgi:glycosyltransferase involved in cell wall biosynthesis